MFLIFDLQFIKTYIVVAYYVNAQGANITILHEVDMTNNHPPLSSKQPRFIISGGGTGGHIFPALSIANAIKERWPQAAILFVGAEDRMEMERVPAAGYEIVGLPVAGFDRKNMLKNASVASA